MLRLRLFVWGEMFAYVFLAVLLAWAGISVPWHFRAVSPAVLQAAGKGTPQLAGVSQAYYRSGSFSVSMLLGQVDYLAILPAEQQQQVNALRTDDPARWLVGGSSPYAETFLKMILPENVSADAHREVLPLLLPRHAREELRVFLQAGKVPLVEQLLATRELSGYTYFPAVHSAGGQPLDATIQLAALLAQSGAYSPEFQRSLQQILGLAEEEDITAFKDLEQFYASLMALSLRLDWMQLNDFIRLCPDMAAFERSVLLLQTSPDSLPLFLSAAFLLDSPEPLLSYLEDKQEEGWAALQYAIQWGKGSVELLVAQDKPLYRPPTWIRWLDKPLSMVQEGLTARFTSRNISLAIVAKISLLLASGFVLSILLERLLEISNLRRRRWRTQPLVLFWNFLMALVFASTVWMLLEPSLLKFSQNHAATLKLDFVVANALESLKSQNIEPIMIDQVTIIVLLLFFFIQLLVYVFNLIKIAEIRRQKLSPQAKITLLENEENLFELGLYVGLSGTVLSLILLAMDIVQASLIAAYASTLFGIIFTAILKIFHLRLYRRKLLIEVMQQNPDKKG
ncbi:MAG: hypothetical protein JW739_02765 [Opitutales bacterium]|nr:hypothetical protein [Opitutales bacterium]